MKKTVKGFKICEMRVGKMRREKCEMKMQGAEEIQI